MRGTVHQPPPRPPLGMFQIPDPLSPHPQPGSTAQGGQAGWRQPRGVVTEGSGSPPRSLAPKLEGKTSSLPDVLPPTPAWEGRAVNGGDGGKGAVLPPCCQQPRWGRNSPTFPQPPSCLLETQQRGALTHSLLGLLPRTRGDPFLLPFLTTRLSGLSLPDASCRQPALVTPSHTHSHSGPGLCSPPHWAIAQ